MFLCSVALLAVGSSDASAPRVRSLKVTTRTAAGNLWVIGSFKAQNATQVVTRVVTAAPADTQSHTLPATITRDSFAVPLAASGTNMTGFFSVRSKTSTAQSPWSSSGYSYLVPTPPPTVTLDSIWTRPSVIESSSLGPHNLCAYFWDANKVIKPRNGNSFCDSLYLTFPLSVRSNVPAASQAVADTTCIKWSAPDGGTLNNATCSSVTLFWAPSS